MKREALLVINDFIQYQASSIQHPASGIRHPASDFLFLFVNIRCIINAINKCNTNGKKPFPAGERCLGVGKGCVRWILGGLGAGVLSENTSLFSATNTGETREI